jgi:predicted RNase H-like HicB family nuclease
MEDQINFTVEFDREEDGRWIAEIPELPGVMSYGSTREEAFARTEAIALRVLADRIEKQDSAPRTLSFALV